MNDEPEICCAPQVIEPYPKRYVIGQVDDLFYVVRQCGIQMLLVDNRTSANLEGMALRVQHKLVPPRPTISHESSQRLVAGIDGAKAAVQRLQVDTVSDLVSETNV